MPAAIEALRPTLRSVCSSLALAAADVQIDALLTYLDLLQRWNATYNLTSVRDPAQMLVQHLADCLAVIHPLHQYLGDRTARLLDVGSGGGLPGVVIAAFCPRVDVTCIDAVGKKTAFVQQVAGEVPLKNLQACHGRVERLELPPFELITSRAFASLNDFTALTRRHLAPRGVWVAMKGRSPTEELAQLPGEIDVFHVEQLVVPRLNAERCLVWMRPRSEGLASPETASL